MGLTLAKLDKNGAALRGAAKAKPSPILTYNGKTQTLVDWSDETGIRRGTLLRRIQRGWSVEAALTTAPNPPDYMKGGTPARRKDLSGQKFAHWIVLSKSSQKKYNNWLWLCRCECGTERLIVTGALKGALKGQDATNCGCLTHQKRTNAAKTHGLSRKDGKMTKVYNCWTNMRKRCLNPADKDYPNYGGRGITICARWDSVENFVADMGEPPENTTLDRTDNNGNYEPSNCRWVSRKAQQANRRTPKAPKKKGGVA